MRSFNFCGVKCANQVLLCLLGSNHCHFYREREAMCLAHSGALLQTAVTALIVLSLPFSLLLLNLSFHPSAPPFPFAWSTWLWNTLLFWDLQRCLSLCSCHCLFPWFLRFPYSAGVSTFARLCSPLPRNPSQSFLPCLAFGPIPSCARVGLCLQDPLEGAAV